MLAPYKLGDSFVSNRGSAHRNLIVRNDRYSHEGADSFRMVHLKFNRFPSIILPDVFDMMRNMTFLHK